MSRTMTHRELVRASAAAPHRVSFDPEAFVDDLLAAGCRVSVHQPIGRDAGPIGWFVTPADVAGNPTAGERQVRARWQAAIDVCPDHDERVLVVCRQRVERARTAASCETRSLRREEAAAALTPSKGKSPRPSEPRCPRLGDLDAVSGRILPADD